MIGTPGSVLFCFVPRAVFCEFAMVFGGFCFVAADSFVESSFVCGVDVAG